MTPYMNYLLSEIRAVPSWEFTNPDSFSHFHLLHKVIDCGVHSVGFTQTTELVHALLTVEQRGVLEKYRRVNSTPLSAAFVLTYPPSFDWNWRRSNIVEHGGAAISAESPHTLVSMIILEDNVVGFRPHLRASWLLHRAFPNIPNTDHYIQRTIKTLRKHGQPSTPYTLEEITPLLQTLEPIINQPPREKS